MRNLKTFFCLLFGLFFTIFSLSAQSKRPVVSDIETTTTDQKIIIRWNIPESAFFSNIEELKVYRQTDPFTQKTALKNENLIATVKKDVSFFEDYVKDFRNYYYAVVAKRKDGTLYDVLIPSVNTTVYSAGIAAKNEPTINRAQLDEVTIEQQTKEGKRITPLPDLHILPNQSKDSTKKLSEKALIAVASITYKDTEQKELKPFVFPQDQNIDELTGDQYTLSYIVTSFFERNDWNSAIKELERFLQVKRSDEISQRSAFYLGESYYFLGNTRKALENFLQAEKNYKPESRHWIEQLLNEYTPY